MAGKKRKAAKLGVKAGAGVAPVVGKAAGKAAWKVGKGQAKLVRAAASSREPAGARYLKYGFFALLGLVVGAILSRVGSKDGASSSYTDGTGHHAPDADSPAGERGQTWGSGTPTGTAGGGGAGAHQQPTDPNRTGAERDYSDPASGPLIGEHHSGDAGGVDEAAGRGRATDPVPRRRGPAHGRPAASERRGHRRCRGTAGRRPLGGRQERRRRDCVGDRGRPRGS